MKLCINGTQLKKKLREYNYVVQSNADTSRKVPKYDCFLDEKTKHIERVEKIIHEYNP